MTRGGNGTEGGNGTGATSGGGAPRVPAMVPGGGDAPYTGGGFFRNAGQDIEGIATGLVSLPGFLANEGGKVLAGVGAGAAALGSHLIGDTSGQQAYQDAAGRLFHQAYKPLKDAFGGDNGLAANLGTYAGDVANAFHRSHPPDVRERAWKRALHFEDTLGPGIMRATYEHPVNQVLNVAGLAEFAGSATLARSAQVARAAEEAGQVARAADLAAQAEHLSRYGTLIRAMSHTVSTGGLNRTLPAAGRLAGRLAETHLGGSTLYQTGKAVASRVRQAAGRGLSIPATREGLASIPDYLRDPTGTGAGWRIPSAWERPLTTGERLAAWRKFGPGPRQSGRVAAHLDTAYVASGDTDLTDGDPSKGRGPAKPLPVSVRESEELIRRQVTHETAYVWSEDGHLLITREGEPGRVAFPPDELEKLSDSTFIHNHPGQTSFSDQDFAFACDNNLSQIRVVTIRYRYVLERPAAGWDLAFFRGRVDPAYTARWNEVRGELILRVESNELTKEEATLILFHEVARRTAADVGITYRREEF